MSVGRPSSQLWVNLLQYVGWASPNFVVDLVHAIGVSMAGAYCSSHVFIHGGFDAYVYII